ncbi:MAG: alpha/beta hydrolase [Bacteroidota bacterium]
MQVYKHYSQEQLNNQYNTRLHVPDFADYFDRWEKLSRQTELEYTVFKNISFGTHPLECLDIFPAATPLSKTLIFIHGGYWHLLDKSLFHFIAAEFLKHNVTTVFINYPLAPDVSMNEIVSSCRLAVHWLHENVIRFGGDSSQLYLLGHSAGGHLATMLMTEGSTNFIKAVISLSGLFRLEPIMLSNINDVLQMDKETATINSPVLLKPEIPCPLLLVTGMKETDEFKDQSEELYNSWKHKLRNIDLLKISGKNHYSIVDALTSDNSLLQPAIFKLMAIGAY